MDTILEKAVGPENWYRDSQGLTTWLPGAFADQQSWGLAEAGFLCLFSEDYKTTGFLIEPGGTFGFVCLIVRQGFAVASSYS